LCSTIVAHLCKDGLMFIHPSQDRSLTPREAARIQSFPDWFEFPVAQKHQYRLIGNAVPPLVGMAIGSGIRAWLDSMNSYDGMPIQCFIPLDETEAINWLVDVVPGSSKVNMSDLAMDKFKRAWFAIAFLYGHLHPDGAQEKCTLSTNHVKAQFSFMEERIPYLIRPIYSQSGWPEKLVPVAVEAQRRFNKGELSPVEYYFSEVQIAGLKRAGNQGG
jgi:DNA (cytosine-5)-methyltransferase 1